MKQEQTDNGFCFSAFGEEFVLRPRKGAVRLSDGSWQWQGLHITPEEDGFLIDGEMDGTEGIACPFVLETKATDTLLLPVDEGIALPCGEKAEFFPQSDIPFHSREGTMGLIGLMRGNACVLLSPECASDMGYRVRQDGAALEAELILYPEKGKLGYPRKIRILTSNGIADAMAAYRTMRGKRKTLWEKCAERPQVKKLLGSCDVWVWNDRYEEVMYAKEVSDVNPEAGEDILRVAEEFSREGFQNVLMGIFFQPDGRVVRELQRKYGYLTAKYDNYNDVLPDAAAPYIPENRVRLCDYTARRIGDWPDGILVDREGKLVPAWALPGTDGNWYAQNTLCPSQVESRIRREVPKEEEKAPCDARFVDVLGGSMSECWSEAHPLTRTQCIAAKQKAFEALLEMGLITGTEDGSEALTDVLDYVEGLHSPVFFRYQWQNCGRTKARQYGQAGADFQRQYLLNPRYRVPLWHLAYHDSVAAFPYWGDSTNCCAQTLREKEMFCMLYACPPLYSFFAVEFDSLRDAIFASLRRICAVTERAGFSAMTDFRYLTGDRLVQQTTFSDSTRVAANFSDLPFAVGDTVIPPMSAVILS